MLVKGVHGVHSSEAYRWTSSEGWTWCVCETEGGVYVSKGWCACEERVVCMCVYNSRYGVHVFIQQTWISSILKTLEQMTFVQVHWGR